MQNVEITSVSTKGQIVIPSDLRKQMGLRTGSKLLVFTDGEHLLLKPIAQPKVQEFRELIKASREFAKGRPPQMAQKKETPKKPKKRRRGGSRRRLGR